MKTIFIFLLLSFTLQAQGFKTLVLLMEDEVVAEDVYAVDLNGSNEYATKTSPTDVDLSATTFSIIAWVKTPSTIDGGQRAIISTDANPTRGWVFMLAANEAWAFVMDNSTGVAVVSPAETETDTWRLIIATCFDLTGGVSDYKVYVDGVATTTLNQGNTSSGDSKLTVGQDGYSQGWYYPGLIGQVQIVSGYALTADEVTVLYNAGGTLNASYLGGTVVAWYKWSGTTDVEMLNDYSASGNDLTGTNVTTADQVLIGATY